MVWVWLYVLRIGLDRFGVTQVCFGVMDWCCTVVIYLRLGILEATIGVERVWSRMLWWLLFRMVVVVETFFVDLRVV